jgi:hypothetical protein
MKTRCEKLVVLISAILLINCSNNKYVIYNAIKGIVLSSEDKKPIKDVRIYVTKGCSNDFGILNTDENGSFFIDGLKFPYKYLHDQLNLSYDYHFEKSGYKEKIITIKNLKMTKKNELDTIDLGKIYLEHKK